jgi:membrane-associated protease RseP (regulator of RpoE activity)
MESAPARTAHRLWLHLLLFGVTVGTTSFTFDQQFGAALPLDERLSSALTFSAALLAILGSHEMGHYVLARVHGVEASLPYFIPLPYIGVGTLGAVIRIRDRIPHRNALVDIGAAGPLAGLVVALPIITWGLLHSTVVDVPPVPASTFPGDTSLWMMGRDFVHWVMVRLGQLPPVSEPPFTGHMQWIFSDSLLMRGLQWLVLGPLPEGKDVLVHPVVIAGWFGLLVTLLNLLPVGQLDGGHLTFALWGRRARTVGKVVALVLLFLTLFYTVTWGLWLLVATQVVGFGHPEVTRPAEPLGLGRKLVCALCFLALAGCAMPVPIRMVIW